MPRIAGTSKLSIVFRKTMSVAAASAGRMIGIVTRLKVVTRDAPAIVDASSSAGSIERNAAARIRNGSEMLSVASAQIIPGSDAASKGTMSTPKSMIEAVLAKPIRLLRTSDQATVVRMLGTTMGTSARITIDLRSGTSVRSVSHAR
jgi:hypothetical protein